MVVSKIAEKLPRFVWSGTSLNLVCTIEKKASTLIRGLPEVLEGWNSSDEKAITQLERGCEVLGSVMNGGEEHRSVVKLLADNQNYYGEYKAAAKSVRKARSMLSEQDGKEGKQLLLAQAKAEWNSGDFREALRLGKEAHFVATERESDPLEVGCSLTAVALADLMVYLTTVFHTEHFDAEEELRILETLNKAVISLQSASDLHESPQAVLATSSAMHNVSIAASALRNMYSVQKLPSPNHMKSHEISDALHHLASHSSLFDTAPYYHHQSQSLLASMHCTSAFQILFNDTTPDEKLEQDDLKQASLASQEALEIYKSLKPVDDDVCMSRALFLLATCFTKADSAITSEGLFNSSIDLIKQRPTSPLRLLTLRDTYLAHADLYKKWDKRDTEAEKLRLLAKDVEETSMIESWRYQPGVLSGLWFFTCSDFHM